MSDPTRTYWLSFSDGARPKGQQFLGVCIVDVTPADADAARVEIALKFPKAQPGAEWDAAASRKAYRAGCNPGGDMVSADITDMPAPVPLPKNRLLSFEELEHLGLQPISLDKIDVESEASDA